MNFLEERIVKDGIVKEGNVLKVDSFLNHQMDIELFDQIGAEFKKRFADKNINKILTIEASGIGIACIVAGADSVGYRGRCNCRGNWNCDRKRIPVRRKNHPQPWISAGITCDCRSYGQ